MKLTVINFFLTTLIGLTVLSCKKEIVISKPNETESIVLKRIIDWLDVQKRKFKDSVNQKTIASLEENLVGSQMTKEILNEKQKLIIIPLKNEFKTINVTNLQTFKNLVIIENENNEFILSNIIEIIPKNWQPDKVPANLISKIFNYKGNELNGIVSILSLTNHFMQEQEYKDGKLFSIRNLYSKANTQGAKSTSKDELQSIDCIDWYWQYYVNGILIWEEYAFTTCTGGEEPCRTIRTIDSDTPFFVECGGGSGGTGVVLDDITETRDEADPDTGAPPIRYNYHAAVTRVEGTNEILSVVVDPITATPMASTYTDSYNRNVTRSLTLFGHANSSTPLSPISVLINWNCLVHAFYTYTDGTQSWTRQWSNSKSTIR